MKKYITISIIVIGLMISTFVYAKTTAIRLENSSYVYSEVIDKESLNIIKFVDKTITCYTSITKNQNNNVISTSISCVK